MGSPAPALINRAYAVLTVKAVDGDQRVLSGIATTPTPDRVNDVIEPLGVTFKNPLPFLLYHDSTKPVGTVKFDKPTKDGVTFTAKLPEIKEPGALRDRVEEAWQSVKAGLIRGVSIGFRPLNDAVDYMKDTGGYRFRETEVLELSLVAIPANADATILSIKQFDTGLADAGEAPQRTTTAAAVAPTRVVVKSDPPHKATAMKTIQEQKAAFAQTRETKAARMTEIMQKAAENGVTLDAQESEEYDAIEVEIKSIDEHMKRLDTLEKANIAKAVSVSTATGTEAASAVRGGVTNVVSVKHNLPPGFGFARYVMCQVNSRFSGIPAYELAKQVYPDYTELHNFMLKAAVPAGTTTQAVWASPLVDQQTLASEFIEYLRPQTIIGRLSLRRVPFNVRIPRQTGGGTGYWVGEGAPKPLTSFAFDAVTLGYKKVAAIAVITDELARFSNPGAEGLVRDALRDALVERLDRDFIDPAEAGSASVQPASITNGLVALTSAGTSADNARTDLANILSTFVESHINPTSLALIMPNSLALALSVMVNSLGQPEFPGLTMNGGTLGGIPVITSQYAANASGGGNLVIAVNQSDIFLADDGVVAIDASREASLQMLDNPTNNSATATPTTMVSMFQTNSVALRAERQIDWTKRRAEAVVYMDDVNWGSIGSPA